MNLCSKHSSIAASSTTAALAWEVPAAAEIFIKLKRHGLSRRLPLHFAAIAQKLPFTRKGPPERAVHVGRMDSDILHFMPAPVALDLRGGCQDGAASERDACRVRVLAFCCTSVHGKLSKEDGLQSCIDALGMAHASMI